MSMTKRDFKLVARVLRQHKQTFGHYAIDRIASDLEDAFQRAYPNFSPKKWQEHINKDDTP